MAGNLKDRKGHRGDRWPTREQELLLQATFLRGRSGLEAWEQWKSRSGGTRRDPGSFRLLPQLYRTLSGRGISEPFMDNIRRAYLRTWSENQLRFQEISVLLRSLHAAGIPTMLLKGGALVLQYYHDYGLRPMDDVDILVPEPHALGAIRLLKDLGFTPVWNTAEEAEVVAKHPAYDLKDANGRLVDLHWRVYPERFVADTDTEFWTGAVPVTLHGTPTRALNAADQLLHVCAHGVAFAWTPAVRWVADAMAILTAAPGAVDWDRLLAQAQRRWFILLVRDALVYLRDAMMAPVPSGVVERLKTMPVPRSERIVHRARTRPPELWGPWLALCVRYLEHCATLPPSAGLLQRLAGFPRYFQRRWGANRTGIVPFAAVLRGVRRIVWVGIAYARLWRSWVRR